MFYRRLLHLLRRNRLSRDLDREISFHILELTDTLVAGGMDPADARREALRRFGSRARHKDEARDANRLVRLESVLADVRYAMRSLRRSPGLVIIAIVSLGLGLGAVGAAFSIVDAVRFRALPYPQSDRLIVLSESEPNIPAKYWLRTRFESYEAWQSSLRSVNAIGAYTGAENFPSSIIANGIPRYAIGYAVSANLPSILGARPHLGRLFIDSEDRSGAAPVLILSYRFWQNAFGADPTIVGKSVLTSGVARVIVGVLTREFEWGEDFFVPLAPAHDEYVRTIVAGEVPEFMGRVRIVARLAAGAKIDDARAEAVARAPYPPTGAKPEVRVVTLRDVSLLHWAMYDLVFGVVAALVLLVAMVNLAGLLLVRQLHREREVAVHLSLGAGPARVVWQLALEGLMLTSAGAVLGIVLAALLSKVTWASALEPYRLPTGLTPEVNVVLVSFLAVLALGAALLVTVGPARLVLRGDIQAGLRGCRIAVTGRRPRIGAQRALVIAQIAGAAALLAGAGILTRSLVRASALDVGFDYRRVLAVDVNPPHDLQSPAELATFYRPVLERLGSTPGVESVASEEDVRLPAPPDGTAPGTITVEGMGGRRVVVEPGRIVSAVDAAYFRTLGVPIVAGRTFETRDDPGAVVIVNLAAAKRWWPDESPAGHRIKFGSQQDTTRWLTVVGVVGNGRYTRQLFADPEAPFVYLPMPIATSTGKFILVRSRARNGTTILGAVRAALRGVLPTQPTDAFPVAAHLDRQLSPLRTNTLGILALAGCGLLLAAIGLYGTISYNVGRRVPEIGLRVAVGATRARIVRLVAREAVILTVSGLAGGLAASVALARFIRTVVTGVEPASAADWFVALGVGTVLALVAIFATYLPARRALEVDPVAALKAL